MTLFLALGERDAYNKPPTGAGSIDTRLRPEIRARMKE